MREIKFRAWDEKRKAWRYSDHDSQGNPLLTSVFWQCVEQLNLPVYQFTGLKDKNGKEIYEGDILKDILDTDNGYRSFHNEQNVEVRMDRGNWRYGASEDSWWHDLRERHQSNDKVDMEIIGNIYENPELLNHD